MTRSSYCQWACICAPLEASDDLVACIASTAVHHEQIGSDWRRRYRGLAVTQPVANSSARHRLRRGVHRTHRSDCGDPLRAVVRFWDLVWIRGSHYSGGRTSRLRATRAVRQRSHLRRTRPARMLRRLTTRTTTMSLSRRKPSSPRRLMLRPSERSSSCSIADPARDRARAPVESRAWEDVTAITSLGCSERSGLRVAVTRS